MSIPDAPIHAAGSEQGLETDLILRLAREYAAELRQGNPETRPVPHGPLVATPGPEVSAPVASAAPSIPRESAAARGGLPAPALPGDSVEPKGLSGGYPRATSPTHPPVHPILEAAAPQPGIPKAGTPSGGHDPECAESYAYGEPRCNGTVFPRRDAAPPPALPAAPGAQTPSLGEVPEGVSGSEFYFLERDTPRRSPGLDSAAPAAPLEGIEVEAVRRDFPALHQRVNGRPLIWLDNAATTHKPQAVIDATAHFYSRDNSNIHRAAHTLAARATDLFEGGREKVRRFLGAADAHEIVFVRGTTEAINLVAQSYGREHIGAGDEIVLSRLEHHANIVPWQMLARQTGAVLRVIPINDRGELLLEEFVRILNGRTKIVSVTHVSNALGTINPIEQIIPIAHAHGVPVLVDGAQSTPHIPVNVQALDADFFVFSGHKVFGPTGIGALYGKSSLLESMPPWQGGGHMIRDVTFEKTVYQNAPEKFEAGTPDIAGVVGLGAAIDYLHGLGLPAIAAYEHALLEYATHRLSTVPGLRPVGTAVSKASVLGFVIPGVPNETIARHLDRHGIAVRAGHHCAQPAVRHFGLEGTVRPSLAFYNTHAEVDALVEALHRLPGR